MKHQFTDTLAISFSKVKLSLLILLTGLFTVSSIGLFFEDYFYAKVFGSLGVVLFGFGLLRLVLMFFSKIPALIISSRGIRSNSNHKSIGKVLWKDIEDITFQKSGFQRFVALDLKNPQDYIHQANWMSKLVTRINFTSGHAPIIISTLTLDISLEELTILIQGYFDNFKL